MYLFKKFCVHVQQPPISSESFNTIPLTPQSGGRTVCGVRARVVARLCRQLRGTVESNSSRGRSALGSEPWRTERELQEVLGHMPRACERKVASLLAPSAWAQEA